MLDVDDDMEPAPYNVTLFDTPASDTMFEGQTWGLDGIYCRAVVAQNQNEPSFKMLWRPKSLSDMDIFLYYLPLKWLKMVLLPSTYRATKDAF